MTIPTTNASSPVTLDAIYKKMKHWRDNKQDYEGNGIPDVLWKMFFNYVNAGHSAPEIRRMFSLNMTQYKKKHKELYGSNLLAADEKPHEPVEFCEAIVEPLPTVTKPVPALTDKENDMKKTLRHLKSTHTQPEQYLDTTTVVVECIGPDGHRLKIHTTTQSLDVVMKTFYQQREVCS